MDENEEKNSGRKETKKGKSKPKWNKKPKENMKTKGDEDENRGKKLFLHFLFFFRNPAIILPT